MNNNNELLPATTLTDEHLASDGSPVTGRYAIPSRLLETVGSLEGLLSILRLKERQPGPVQVAAQHAEVGCKRRATRASVVRDRAK